MTKVTEEMVNRALEVPVVSGRENYVRRVLEAALSTHQESGETLPPSSEMRVGHTPTPWAIRQDNDDWEIFPLRDGPPKIGEWSAVATCHDQYDDGDEAKANAELILAAVNAYCGPREQTPSEETATVDWENPDDPAVKLFVGFDVEGYVEEYELCGDGGDYSPNEQEKTLIADAIYGVIFQLHEGMRNIIPSNQPPVQHLAGGNAYVTALRAALEPFAEAAPYYDNYRDPLVLIGRGVDCLTVADLRLAKAAFDTPPPVHQMKPGNFGIEDSRLAFVRSQAEKPSDTILQKLDRAADYSWDAFVSSLTANDIARLRAALPPTQEMAGGDLNEKAIDEACTAGLKAAVAAPGIYRNEIKAAVTAYLANAAVVDFNRLYTHPLAQQFHEAIQAVENLGCDSTAEVNQLHALGKSVEQEINRLSAPPIGEVTEDMLNEGQERMCQMASRTIFEDHIQAEIYKAMRNVDPSFRSAGKPEGDKA